MCQEILSIVILKLLLYNKNMKKLNESYIEIKKSKFYGYLYELNSFEEIELIINELSEKNKKAKHIVYAYKYDSQEKNYADKEPSGTTRGLLDIIHMKNLNKCLIVVVRYFGGTLLGSGLLTRTYTKCASMLIEK